MRWDHAAGNEPLLVAGCLSCLAKKVLAALQLGERAASCDTIMVVVVPHPCISVHAVCLAGRLLSSGGATVVDLGGFYTPSIMSELSACHTLCSRGPP